MIAPPDVTKAATNFQSHATSNVCNVAQRAALAAVSGDLDGRRRDARGVRAARPHDALDAVGDRRRHVPRAAGRVLLLPERQRPARPRRSAAGRARRRSSSPTTCSSRRRSRSSPVRRSARPATPGSRFALGDDDLAEGIRRLATLAAAPQRRSAYPSAVRRVPARTMASNSWSASGITDRRLPRASRRDDGELGHRPQLVERDEAQLAHRRDGDPVPARIGGIRGRVVVLAGRVELGRVGLGAADDLADARRSGWLGVGVVDDRLVADLASGAGRSGPGSCGSRPSPHGRRGRGRRSRTTRARSSAASTPSAADATQSTTRRRGAGRGRSRRPGRRTRRPARRRRARRR